MSFINNPRQKATLLFSIGLFIHVILNWLLAANMGVHFDEAYYWLYSQNPDWGYFDHPPMIAWFIMLGSSFFNGLLGLRFVTLVSSTLSLILIWDMVKKYKPDPVLFWALIYSVVLIHPYSFIATPDGPLFFFTVCFFYMYKKYLQKASFSNSLLLALSIAMMLYSKYHGILVVGFTVLSNLKLLKRWTFWFILVCTILYLSPHILWQFDHNFMSLRYHLIDSHKSGFKLEVVINYIVSELALTSPFLGWLFLYAMWKTPKTDKWELALQITGVGTFLFFFLSSFGGDFEAHWTLIAFVPLIILSFKYCIDHPKWQKWVKISGLVNFTILLVAKILLTFPIGDNIKALDLFKGWEKATTDLKHQIGDYPIVFQDSWNRAARFAYYSSDNKVGNLNSAFYRHNQFDLLDLDEELKGETVYVLSRIPSQFKDCDTLRTLKTVWYGKKIKDFRSFYNLVFTIDDFSVTKETYKAKVTISNPYDEEVHIGWNTNYSASFQLNYRTKVGWKTLSEMKIPDLVVGPKGEIEYNVEMQLPEGNQIQSVYLMLKIGELNPIPMKYEVKIPVDQEE